MMMMSSTTIKQQPSSPIQLNSFMHEFYSHQHLSSASSDHEPISPISNYQSEQLTRTNRGPSSTLGVERGAASPDDKRRCAVCSDTASGYHYGVWSCEGCKAFFKRSIQGTNDYICPATNTCTIDKHRRKSCQACRLRRCYEVGMTKGTTRRERKHRRKAVSVCKITSTSQPGYSGNKNLSESGIPTAISTPPATSSTSSAAPINNYHSSSHTAKNNYDSSRIPITPADFISTLSQASRLNLPAKIDSSRSLDDQYFLQLLAKIFDQELVVLINWAKAMPGYTENLTLDQQVTIIEQSWLDTLILDIIERSLDHHDDTLHFAPDLIITRNRDLSSPCLGSICTYLFQILQVFKHPRTTHEEFIALKATMLINSLPSNVAQTKSYRMLSNQIYSTVKFASDSNPHIYQDHSLRHFTLLLQLPHIKILSAKLMKLFLDMRANDYLPQADLLMEMLEAQDSFDISLNLDSHQTTTKINSVNGSSTLYSEHFSDLSTMNIDQNSQNDQRPTGNRIHQL